MFVRHGVSVSAGGNDYTIEVQQLGYGPAILVADKTVAAEGGMLELKVTSNIDYTVGDPQIGEQDDAGWIETDVSEPEVRAFADRTYRFIVQANTQPFERKATIAIDPVDQQYAETAVVCTVTQQTQTLEPGANLDDERVEVLSATDNQHHEGNGADKTIDGDMQTNYHSPWELPIDDPTTTFPVVLEYAFDGTKAIDYIRIYSGSGNGRPGKLDISYKSQGAADYVALNDEEHPFDLQQKGGEQTVYLPSRLENVASLKLSFRDGAGDNKVSGGFISIYEVEFYLSRKDLLNEAMLRVFTDLSCSELREDVTRESITALYQQLPYLAQEIAVPLQNGTYDSFEYEFRVQSYAPYSNNEINLQLLTKMYSRMDNPTGIEVATGDEILVCVDKVPEGQTLSLAVYGEASDGYGPNYGGMSQG